MFEYVGYIKTQPEQHLPLLADKILATSFARVPTHLQATADNAALFRFYVKIYTKIYLYDLHTYYL